MLPSTAAGMPSTPSSIRLETSSYCNLRCPSCPTTTRAIDPTIGRGFLKLADFQQLLRANPGLRHIELSNYGEIFLNPDLIPIMAFAHERGVRLAAHNGANFNRVTDEQLAALVRYEFDAIRCSIDGASDASYRIYRRNGDFGTVISNIEKLNALKRAHGATRPVLVWQFVVMGHNEHEIPLAREMAQRLGMNFQLKLTWDPDFAPVQDHAALRRELGDDATTREEYLQKHGVPYLAHICDQLWDNPQYNWDGKLLGCCRNFWGDFGGNLFQDGLAGSLQAEKLHYARAMLLGHAEPRADIPCTTCELYLARRKTGRWLKRRPIRHLLARLVRRFWPKRN